MPDQKTVEDLFLLAIKLEGICRNFYLGLEAKFDHYPELADYWHAFAEDEGRHAALLESLQCEMLPAELSQPVISELFVGLQQLLREPADAKLNSIENFDQAYIIANELEQSELNSTFLFVFENYSVRKDLEAFAKDMLKNHVNKLWHDLPTNFQTKQQRIEALAHHDKTAIRQN